MNMDHYDKYVAKGNCMQPTFGKGDILFVSKVERKMNSFKEGDVICYKSGEKVLAHRVYQVGEKYIVTKADSFILLDKKLYDENRILGKVKFIIDINTNRFKSVNYEEPRVKLIRKLEICERDIVTDLGSGAGTMAIEVARQTGAFVDGYDHSIKAVCTAREFGVKSGINKVSFHKEKIEEVGHIKESDVITMYMALRHLYNPVEIVQSVLDKMKKGARLGIVEKTGEFLKILNLHSRDQYVYIDTEAVINEITCKNKPSFNIINEVDGDDIYLILIKR